MVSDEGGARGSPVVRVDQRAVEMVGDASAKLGGDGLMSSGLRPDDTERFQQVVGAVRRH